MTNYRITDLVSYSNPDAVNDVIEIVDTVNNQNKKISRNSLLGIVSQPVGLTDTQTLTGKTLTAPVISSPVLSGIISGTYTIGGTPTFPSSIVTLTGSQTLTGKTLISPTINAPTITNASITADAVTGFTNANTGTIYGIAVTAAILSASVISGGTLGTNTVNTASLSNASVTPSKLATGAANAVVATSESTSSTSYADLATTTDTVMVTIGANGLALIIFGGHITNNTTANIGYISFAASGTNTIAASDSRAFYEGALTGLSQGQGTWGYLATGLTPGSTTFKMKYRTSANSCTFDSRTISVVPL